MIVSDLTRMQIRVGDLTLKYVGTRLALEDPEGLRSALRQAYNEVSIFVRTNADKLDDSAIKSIEQVWASLDNLDDFSHNNSGATA